MTPNRPAGAEPDRQQWLTDDEAVEAHPRGPLNAHQRYLQALMDEHDAYDWEQSGRLDSWLQLADAIEAEARAATPPALDVLTQQRILALERKVLDLGGVLGYFEHGVATRSAKPSDPDDVRWECLCGIGGAPERVRRHWAVELADWHAAAEDWSSLSAQATEETA